jgi:hypothetical protein
MQNGSELQIKEEDNNRLQVSAGIRALFGTTKSVGIAASVLNIQWEPEVAVRLRKKGIVGGIHDRGHLQHVL